MDSVSSILVVSPHPDDETFGCGGTLARFGRSNVVLHVAFVTDGAASHPGHPIVGPSELAVRRTAEAFKAAQALGIEAKNLRFLGEHDGTLARLSPAEADNAVKSISGLVEELCPAAILMPCRSDGSSEHDAVFSLVSRALRQAGRHPRILEYPVWSWWNPLRLLSPLLSCRRVWRVDVANVLALKANAMSAYSSQLLPIPPDTAAALPLGFDSMFQSFDEFLFEW